MTRWLHELCPLHAGGRERDWELQYFTIGIEESIVECGEEVFGVLISVYRYMVRTGMHTYPARRGQGPANGTGLMGDDLIGGWNAKPLRC